MSAERGFIFIGDLVRAISEIESNHQKTINQIAHLLGFEIKEEEAVKIYNKETTFDFEPKNQENVQKDSQEKNDQELGPEKVVIGDDPDDEEQILNFKIIKQRKKKPIKIRPNTMDWNESSFDMDYNIPHVPILKQNWTRAILIEALSTLVDQGEVDTSRVIDKFARGETIDKIPRFMIPTLKRGCQVLIDVGVGMEPYENDKKHLLDEIRKVVGKDELEVLYFDGIPGMDVETWDDFQIKEYPLPPVGTPVFVITDLGISNPDFTLTRSSARDWEQFYIRLNDKEIPLIALTPYPPQRWPTELNGMFPILQWKHSLTAMETRRQRRR